MTLSIPFHIQWGEIRLLKDVLEEPWQEQHLHAMQAWDWDFIVEKCLSVAASFDRAWELTCQEMVATGLNDVKEREQFIRDLFDSTILVLRSLHAKVTQFVQQTDHTIERLDELEAAVPMLEQKREDCLFQFSLLDSALVEQAKAEHAAGDYPSAGIALADLLAARHAARITPSYAELRAAGQIIPLHLRAGMKRTTSPPEQYGKEAQTWSHSGRAGSSTPSFSISKGKTLSGDLLSS